VTDRLLPGKPNRAVRLCKHRFEIPEAVVLGTFLIFLWIGENIRHEPSLQAHSSQIISDSGCRIVQNRETLEAHPKLDLRGPFQHCVTLEKARREPRRYAELSGKNNFGFSSLWRVASKSACHVRTESTKSRAGASHESARLPQTPRCSQPTYLQSNRL
jgi:hypothetical protein